MVKEIKPNEVYTTEETRKYLKISESTIKRHLKNRVIRAAKIGNQYRILGKEILRLISPEAERHGANLYQELKKKTKTIIKNW
ncbi:MAG: helix-turn-helix domain-containing protein [Candidatus Aenigmarchaeota archaeon]|nr:helix-turn-helix domain-containing protein [Candidatus Aenigmarchaeota archaeon]